MKLSTSVLALAALYTPSLASIVNTKSPYAVKGSHPVPPRWERLDRAHPNTPIELRIGLKQGDFDELERQLYESELHSKHDNILLILRRIRSQELQIWSTSFSRRNPRACKTIH